MSSDSNFNRDATSFLGVLIRVIAGFVLVGGVIYGYKLSEVKNSLGSSEYSYWVPIGVTAGAFVAFLILFGIGSAFALLCSVYDRQGEPALRKSQE